MEKIQRICDKCGAVYWDEVQEPDAMGYRKISLRDIFLFCPNCRKFLAELYYNFTGERIGEEKT